MNGAVTSWRVVYVPFGCRRYRLHNPEGVQWGIRAMGKMLLSPVAVRHRRFNWTWFDCLNLSFRDATDMIKITSIAIAPDSSAELRKCGALSKGSALPTTALRRTRLNVYKPRESVWTWSVNENFKFLLPTFGDWLVKVIEKCREKRFVFRWAGDSLLFRRWKL